MESSSKLKIFLPIFRLRCFFALLIPPSRKPPKWGACGGMKFDSKCCPADTACTEFSVVSLETFLCLRSSWEPWIFEPLSELIVAGQPFLDVKHRSAAIHAWIARSEMISRCTALLAKHTNKAHLLEEQGSLGNSNRYLN